MKIFSRKTPPKDSKQREFECAGLFPGMKMMLKRSIGTSLVFLAGQLPPLRKFLRPLGRRTSGGRFGNRAVSIQSSKHRSFQLTHVDESYLAFQLFWNGADYYEPLTRALLETILRPGDAFLDLGAHIGFFSIVAGRWVPGVRVIAFEPNPKNFRILQANVAANGLTRFTCEPIAISDVNGIATMYLTESDMSASLMKDFQLQDTKQIDSIAVQTTSLDNYLLQHRIEGPMAIKVDIEGYEPAFFRGATETLSQRKPDIILEVLYDQEPTQVAWLKSLGYHFYPITDEGLIELETPKLVKRFPFLFLNHLLSVRPKREVASLFERARQRLGSFNPLETSEHFPPDEWPLLWQEEPSSSGSSAPNSVARYESRTD